MKSEKGVTLIEVLTALTILFMVMGIGYGLYSSVHLFYKQSQENSTSQMEETIIVNTLTRELDDPVTLYLASNNELRFKTFEGKYKSVYFDSSLKTIFLNESNTLDLVNFTVDDSNALSNKVIDFKFNDETGNHFTPPVNLPNDRIYSLDITIETNKPRVNGESTIENRSINISIKPFKIN